jgi:hypothetical protein
MLVNEGLVDGKLLGSLDSVAVGDADGSTVGLLDSWRDG